MTDKPKIQTELEFLDELERGDVTSQLSLSKRISVSVGFVNALLKRAVQKGFVKVSTAPRRRYAYYITPQGFREKSRLVTEYLESSLQFFRKARGEYGELFEQAHASGIHRFAFIGGGELAEIALLAARELDCDLVGVVDPDITSERHHGLPVFAQFDNLPADTTLVVTDSREPQAAYEKAQAHADEARILAPPLLRIVRRDDKSDSAAEAAE